MWSEFNSYKLILCTLYLILNFYGTKNIEWVKVRNERRNVPERSEVAYLNTDLFYTCYLGKVTYCFVLCSTLGMHMLK
jgi:hypothetical protein